MQTRRNRNEKNYYFPDSEHCDAFFWSGLRRLAFEWDMEYEDLLEQVHEASEAEIAEYGVYNSEE